jgi:hypothetical protein
MEDLLNAATAIPQGKTPTGRQIGIRYIEGYGLYKLKYIDGQTGTLPAEIAGMYTKSSLADAALKNYLTQAWAESDRIAERNRLRAYKDKHGESKQKAESVSTTSQPTSEQSVTASAG